MGHQAAQAPTAAELAEWRNLWNLLSAWYGRPSSETFLPASLLAPAKGTQGPGMKIVHVLTRGDVLGGAQSHVRELSLELRSLGHEVTVITGAPGIFTDQLRQVGIPWLQVKSLVRPLRPHLDVAALVELWCALGRLKPDLVCAHTAKAGSLGAGSRAAAPHPQCVYSRTDGPSSTAPRCGQSRSSAGQSVWPAGWARVSSTYASTSESWRSNSASARQRRWRWCITA